MASFCRLGWGNRCLCYGSTRHTLGRKLGQAVLMLFSELSIRINEKYLIDGPIPWC
jgi:hypothetical protein